MVTALTSKLWDIVNSSTTYNFAKNPLPVFFLLYAGKCHAEFNFYSDEFDEYTLNYSKRDDLYDDLKEASEELLCQENLFEDFWDEIYENEEVRYEYLRIIDFFVEKYIILNGYFTQSRPFSQVVQDLAIEYFELWPGNGMSLYNPQAFLGSYSMFPSQEFHGFESIKTHRLIARIRMEANHFDDVLMESSGTSIPNENRGDIIISDYYCFHSLQLNTDALIEEFIKSENSAILVLPKSFLTDDDFTNLRKTLIERRLVEFVVSVPHAASLKHPGNHILLGLSYSKYSSNKHIDFIDGNQILSDGTYLNLEMLHHNIKNLGWSSRYLDEFRSSIFCRYSYEKVIEEGYHLSPSFYSMLDKRLLENQSSDLLGNIFQVVQPIPEEYVSTIGACIEDSAFSDLPLSILGKEKSIEDRSTKEKVGYTGPCLIIRIIRDKMTFLKWNSDQAFYTSPKDLVLKVKNDNEISLDYASYILMSSEYFRRREFVFTEIINSRWDSSSKWLCFQNIRIPFASQQSEQEKVMNQLKSEYAQAKRKELEAELQRLGIRQASSDMAHMLGHTFDTIGVTLDDLKAEGLTEEGKRLVNVLNDNMDYIHRFVQTTGADLMNEKVPFSFDEREVNETIKTVLKSWSNLSTAVTFKTEYKSDISDETTFMVDDSYIKVLFDTLLDNAYRHGFGKNPKPENKVQITSKGVRMDDKDYILLTIANNGKPFSADFTLKKFISRGEFCGESGRTGLGGNHIHSIVKRHNGFLYVTQNDEWNCIFEILLPIEYQDEVESKNNREYEHIRECI